MEFLSPSTPCKLAKNKLATSRNNYASHNTPVKSSATSLSSSSSSLIATNYQTPDRSISCSTSKKENEDDNGNSKTATDLKTIHQNKFKEEVLQLTNKTPGKRMLPCFESSPVEEYSDVKQREYTPRKTPNKSTRNIPSAPSKILDAPELMDDYYLNLLSWGCNNIIAIALYNSVYLWNAKDGQIDRLVTLEDSDYVSSVSFGGLKDPNCLAIGTSAHEVQIWDVSRLTKVRDLSGHSERVSSLSWNSNTGTLSSGGRDSMILNHDVRQQRSIQSTYLGHQQEVCGLSWSTDGSTLASGGNDNMLCLWDVSMSSTSQNSLNSPSSRRLGHHSSSPRHILQSHIAAVKAISWCPFQRNLLASGGGTADRTIRLWNTSSGDNLTTIDTGSQVCAMQWSESHRELISSHGFTDNQLCLWKYGQSDSSLTKIKELRGHTARVLHMAKSPNGSQIITAGADETLRFWDVFASQYSTTGSESKSKLSSSFAGGMNLLHTGPGIR